MHDPVYRRLFGFPRMVGDLLKAVGDPAWLGDVDLETLEKLPADHVGDDGQQRRGDAAWRVRFRDGWLYLLVLLEFQSRSDALMALRNLEYTALLYRELDRRDELGPQGHWPPVPPVVLYNGDAPWTAALEMRDLVAPVSVELSPFQPSQRSLLLDERRVAVDDLPFGNLMRAVVGFEQSRTPADMVEVARALRGWLRSPGDIELGRAFAELDAADGRADQSRRGRGGTRRDLGGSDDDVGGTGGAVAGTVAPGGRGGKAAGRTPGRPGSAARAPGPVRGNTVRRNRRRAGRGTPRWHRGLEPAGCGRGADRHRTGRVGPDGRRVRGCPA